VIADEKRKISEFDSFFAYMEGDRRALKYEQPFTCVHHK